ncbi:hypothetical protein CHARACLAT_019901, partial [Characodon lateralis]|nr:hypothetical protein [Characodon lateralis]
GSRQSARRRGIRTGEEVNMETMIAEVHWRFGVTTAFMCDEKKSVKDGGNDTTVLLASRNPEGGIRLLTHLGEWKGL